MILTLSKLSKKLNYALYTGAANVLRIPVAAFPDKIAPTSIEVVGDVFAAKVVKTPRAKMTQEEKDAAKLARKNAPKPTLAERAAAARKRADALDAKARAADSM